MELRCETWQSDFELSANFACARVDSDSPSLEEVDVVELVELQRYLDGRLQLAARHFAVAVGRHGDTRRASRSKLALYSSLLAREQITSETSLSPLLLLRPVQFQLPIQGET